MPIEISVAMILVTASLGQVFASKVLEVSQSLAASSWTWSPVCLGWRDRTEGTVESGDDDILSSCDVAWYGEILEMEDFFGGGGRESGRESK